jgi:FemAB-related protein (PEP-CTERM system-associated)
VMTDCPADAPSRRVTVRTLAEGDAPQWDEFVQEHPAGSPFHLQAWRRTIEESFGYHPMYLLAEEGDKIRGVLPLFYVKNVLVKSALISSPFAVYGGILADSREAALALRNAAEKLGRDLGVQHIEFRNAHLEQCVGESNISGYVNFVQQIGPDTEAILEAIPRKTRAMVRKALKLGFKARVTRDLDAFEALYSKNLRRLGTPSFPHKYFGSLLKHFGSSVFIHEFELDGQVVSAVLTFCFRDQILPYYGASDLKFNSSAPNNFMYFNLMQWGGLNGYRVYDFGRSRRHSGSYEFKAHWGMVERTLPYEMVLVRRKNLPNFSPANPKYQLAMRIWQKLPLAVTRAVGPSLLKLVP